MPEGMGYPKGDAILGKVKQGELGSDVAKRPNEKLNMNPNQKIKQGDLGSESGSVGKKEKVDASIFKNDNNPTNKKVKVRDY